MTNEDYFNYIKDRPFIEKLEAFGHACEYEAKYAAEGAKPGIGEDNRKYCTNRHYGELERAEFLFKNLIEDYARR